MVTSIRYLGYKERLHRGTKITIVVYFTISMTLTYWIFLLLSAIATYLTCGHHLNASRVVNNWNKLPAKIVDAALTNDFKI